MVTLSVSHLWAVHFETAYHIKYSRRIFSTDCVCCLHHICYLGLLHFLVRRETPPPQVREQGDNWDQLDQEPCTTTEEPSSPEDTQRPFRHHWKTSDAPHEQTCTGLRSVNNTHGDDCSRMTHWWWSSTWSGAHSVQSSRGTRRRLQELLSSGLMWQDSTRQAGWWHKGTNTVNMTRNVVIMYILVWW